MNYVRNKLRQYIAALLPSRIYEQVCPVLSHCLHPHPLHPIRLPIPSGSQLLRLPVTSIITPSLATRIILAHTASSKSTSQLAISNSQLCLGSSLSPLALLSAAIALIRNCSVNPHPCVLCSPFIPYTTALGDLPAASLLAMDNVTFDLHVLPFLLNTPMAQSLPRARVDLRAQAQDIAGLIGLRADDLMWAFRCEHFVRVCVTSLFRAFSFVTSLPATSLPAPWRSRCSATRSIKRSPQQHLLRLQTIRYLLLGTRHIPNPHPSARARWQPASRPWFLSPIFATTPTRGRCRISNSRVEGRGAVIA